MDLDDSKSTLARALAVGEAAASLGFDWDSADGALDKVAEEIDELRLEIARQGRVREELGDLLFAVVNVARKSGIDPDQALAAATSKFERRFEALLAEVARSGRNPHQMSLDELEAVWVQVKRGGAEP